MTGLPDRVSYPTATRLVPFQVTALRFIEDDSPFCKMVQETPFGEVRIRARVPTATNLSPTHTMSWIDFVESPFVVSVQSNGLVDRNVLAMSVLPATHTVPFAATASKVGQSGVKMLVQSVPFSDSRTIP